MKDELSDDGQSYSISEDSNEKSFYSEQKLSELELHQKLFSKAQKNEIADFKKDKVREYWDLSY